MVYSAIKQRLMCGETICKSWSLFCQNDGEFRFLPHSVHKSQMVFFTSTTGTGFCSIPPIISKTAKTVELSTVNPKQSPVVPLTSPRLDTPRHENLPAQVPTSPGSPPGNNQLPTLTQELTANTFQLYEPPKQNHSRKIDYRSFERVEEFKYLEKILTN